jgi:hypothetical protein
MHVRNQLVKLNKINSINFSFHIYISQHLSLIAKLLQQLVHTLHNHATLTLGWRLHLLHGDSGRNIKAELLQLQHLHRLLLRLQDILHVSEARCVQTQVDCENCRQRNLDLLQAEVDLAHDLGSGGILVELDLGAEGSRGHIHDASQDLARLHVVVIDGLLAQDCEVELLLCHHVLEDLGDGQWLQLLVRGHVGKDVDAGVCAHREGIADHVHRLLGPDRDGHNLFDFAGFAHLEGFLHGDLVEGVNALLEAFELNAGLLGVDSDLDGVVEAALDTY